MTDQLLAPSFLFRYSVPCLAIADLWPEGGPNLTNRHVLPTFGELEGRPLFAVLKAAWNDEGLAFDLEVQGKRQVPWCRQARAEDSDGLQVWIDTRDTHNIHRAGRFCHRFAFLPYGSGTKADQPTAQLLEINRARENPKSVAPHILRVASEAKKEGYRLTACIPAKALTGFDPAEHPRLGFSYAVIDRELGWQTFTVGTEFPFTDDPSLWGTLELVKK